MGRHLLSCSFLWKRSTNSLWLSSRLKVRLKLVSNMWWTPVTMIATFRFRGDSICLNKYLLSTSCFTCIEQKSHIFTHQGLWRKTSASCLPLCCWGHTGLRGRLWTAVRLTPPPPSALSHQPVQSKWYTVEHKRFAKAVVTGNWYSCLPCCFQALWRAPRGSAVWWGRSQPMWYSHCRPDSHSAWSLLSAASASHHPANTWYIESR